MQTNAQTVDTAVARQIIAAKDTTIKPTIPNPAFTETDSTKIKNPKARKPGTAALRSAILPGWGQVYNKKVWKVPIVYAAIGATAGFFVNNLVWYKRFRNSYSVAIKIQNGEDSLNSPSYNALYEDIRKVFFESSAGIRSEVLQDRRNYYRRNMDYSAVYFLIAWALNVVDATVDAHLSTFDVSPNLSFQIQPGYSEMARTNGVSLVLKFK